MNWLKVSAWSLVCLVACPLWPLGAALAWTHRLLSAASAAVIRWGFWEPTQRSWRALVASYHRAKVKADVLEAERVEADRLARARVLQRKARRRGWKGGR